MKIVKVNFDVVFEEAMDAAQAVLSNDWNKARDYVENICKSLISDSKFVLRKLAKNEFNEEDARAFMEDQKTAARTSLRSLFIIGVQLVEDVLNAIAEVFREALKTATKGLDLL